MINKHLQTKAHFSNARMYGWMVYILCLVAVSQSRFFEGFRKAQNYRKEDVENIA